MKRDAQTLGDLRGLFRRVKTTFTTQTKLLSLFHCVNIGTDGQQTQKQWWVSKIADPLARSKVALSNLPGSHGFTARHLRLTKTKAKTCD